MKLKFLLLLLSSFLLISCGKSDSPQNPPNTEATQSTIASPTLGENTNVITVYADFQCPACQAFNRLVSPLLEEYVQRDLVQVVYKQFPLTSIHRNAERDALAALCSAEQGKFKEYKDALYAFEERKSGATVNDQERISLGNAILDTAKFEECISSDRYLDQVKSEVAEGIKLGVTGTPTVFLNGRRVDNRVFANLDQARVFLDRQLTPQNTATGSVQ